MSLGSQGRNENNPPIPPLEKGGVDMSPPLERGGKGGFERGFSDERKI